MNHEVLEGVNEDNDLMEEIFYILNRRVYAVSHNEFHILYYFETSRKHNLDLNDMSCSFSHWVYISISNGNFLSKLEFLN